MLSVRRERSGDFGRGTSHGSIPNFNEAIETGED
jgi:hypothetical protein